MQAPELRRTPLFARHERLGARMVGFAGWSMPVSYPAGILAEHHATRNAVGLFDVSHMGELHFRGPGALSALQRLMTNNVGRLADGQALYTVACRETGGVVDDLIVYRLGPEHFVTVVNAGNLAGDLAWFREATGDRCAVEDASDATALLAYQGPRAIEIVSRLTALPIGALAPFHFRTDARLAGAPCWLARTGYTGEDGVEIFCKSENAPAVWDTLHEAAVAAGGLPVGLGARDTLRLEARLPLYGNELSLDTSPLEAGLGWVVKLDKGDFIGRRALVRQKEHGLTRKLCGLILHGRGIARRGYAIHAGGTNAGTGAASAIAPAPIGTITSGGPGPTVGKNIGLGYLPVALANPGTRVFVDCRGKMSEAEVVAGPFYRRPASSPNQGMSTP